MNEILIRYTWITATKSLLIQGAFNLDQIAEGKHLHWASYKDSNHIDRGSPSACCFVARDIYTGAKDSQGNPIFVGDIIKTETGALLSVFYRSSDASFVGHVIDSKENIGNIPCRVRSGFGIVVNNIHKLKLN